MTLALVERDGWLQFAVKVVPGAARDRLAGGYGEALKVQVSAPPEHGQANARLLELLRAALGVRGADLRLVAGASSPRKQVAVRGLPAAAVRQRLLG